MLSQCLKQLIVLSCLGAYACYGQQAAPDQNEISFSLGATSYSNVFQAPAGQEVSDVSRDFLSRISYMDVGNVVQTEFDYAYAAQDFRDSSFETEKTLTGRAKLILGSGSLPLRWMVSNREQVLRDSPVTRSTLADQRQRSIYSTGPIIGFRLSPVDVVSASAKYEVINISRSNTDTLRKSGELLWEHETSTLSSIGLAGRVATVEAKNIEDFTYDQSDVGIIYKRLFRLFELSAEVGVSSVSSFRQSEDVQEAIYDIAIASETPRSRFLLASTLQLIDSSIGNNLDFSGFDNEDFALTDEDFVLQERVRNSLRWGFQLSPRLRTQTGFSRTEVRGIEVNQEESLDRISFMASYQATPFLTIGAGGTYRESEDTGSENALEQTLTTKALTIDYIISRSVSTGCGVRELVSEGNLEYQDRRVGCSITYVLL